MSGEGELGEERVWFCGKSLHVINFHLSFSLLKKVTLKRKFTCARCLASSNPSRSMVRFLSSAIKVVRSTGKP